MRRVLIEGDARGFESLNPVVHCAALSNLRLVERINASLLFLIMCLRA